MSFVSTLRFTFFFAAIITLLNVNVLARPAARYCYCDETDIRSLDKHHGDFSHQGLLYSSDEKHHEFDHEISPHRHHILTDEDEEYYSEHHDLEPRSSGSGSGSHGSGWSGQGSGGTSMTSVAAQGLRRVQGHQNLRGAFQAAGGHVQHGNHPNPQQQQQQHHQPQHQHQPQQQHGGNNERRPGALRRLGNRVANGLRAAGRFMTGRRGRGNSGGRH